MAICRIVSEFLVKKGKKRGIVLKKSLICDQANPLIKNRTPQGFYKVFKKKMFSVFHPKLPFVG
jgi:hypothetical protein